MLQSALELVSGESLSPTQCTVGNFVQLSGVIQTDLSPCIHKWGSCIPLFKGDYCSPILVFMVLCSTDMW